MFKSIFIVALSLGALVAALPTPTEQGVADGCDYAYRGEHRDCERARDQKHDGRREERQGERQIQNGNLIGGLANIIGGSIQQGIGSARQCAAGGRC